ncbi:MAG: GspH/FimT family protein [Candidatus Acidiferrum sp.]
MKRSANFASPAQSPQNGFSLVELVLSLAVLLVISTLAIPVVVRSLQSYQLNSAASQLAGMLKYAKFDAIRQNTKVSCIIKSLPGGKWLVWVDSNGNGIADNKEPQMIIGGTFTLLASAPSPTPITNSLGPGYVSSSYTWTVLSGSNASITYDQRGVIDSYLVSVLYLGSASGPNIGYRAVLTLPSGAVQVWTSSAAGDWQRVS